MCPTNVPGAGDGTNPVVQVDPDENYNETDSSYESDTNSYTTSLAEGVTNYQHENGRRYHAYKQGKYYFANDERESDRLDIIHTMITTSMDGKLFSAPLKEPKRILDLGTGTGIWAIEMADQFPEADVTGNDLSPTQPKWVPPNVHFEVDDIEEPWVYSRPFDYIHSRVLSTAIYDWPKLVRQMFEHTAPGGWVEFQDFDAEWKSPDGSLTKDHAIWQVGDAYIQAGEKAGVDPSPGPKLAGWCKDAGFVEVKAVKHPMPAGVWPADKKLKNVGAWQYLQLNENIDGTCMALFTRVHGMSEAEVHVLAAKFRAELKNPKLHPLLEMWVVTARKPEAKAEQAEVDT